jgi:hypothetical protein
LNRQKAFATNIFSALPVEQRTPVIAALQANWHIQMIGKTGPAQPRQNQKMVNTFCKGLCCQASGRRIVINAGCGIVWKSIANPINSIVLMR